MKTQLIKYLDTKFFNEAFEIHPSKKTPADPSIGLITIDSAYNIKVIRKKIQKKFFNEREQKEYIAWLSNYVKYYLIANFTQDEFIDFYQEKNNRKISSITDITVFINSLSYEEILEKIRAVCNGTIK